MSFWRDLASCGELIFLYMALSSANNLIFDEGVVQCHLCRSEIKVDQALSLEELQIVHFRHLR